MTLQKKIDEQSLTSASRPRHLDPDAPSEFPIPKFGEHDLEPPSNSTLWEPPELVRE
jgi:NADH-quinone oxidoreductase subunit B